MSYHRIALALCLLTAAPSAAADDALPSDARLLIERGVEAYKLRGALAALEVWLAGGPLEQSKEKSSHADTLRKIQGFYGQLTGHHVTRAVRLADSTWLAFAVLDLERGPLFARYVLYRRGARTWIITSFNIHTDVGKVWPDEVSYR